MKIMVEVEVPDGEYCNDGEHCNDCQYLDDSDRYDYDGYIRRVNCNLFPNDRGILTKDDIVKKIPLCLTACQKAIEQKAEMEQIRRAKTERVKYCVAHGIPCEEEE